MVTDAAKRLGILTMHSRRTPQMDSRDARPFSILTDAALAAYSASR